ncbi:hypothetical protein KY084_02245 [Stakelama sp. CBK3Z-3]|uniref:Anti-sigma factor NepR domain-containing protein n=1 Tax=Stakelama flava TaxID=2860338 RepID=A0ABS6XHL2_9SPHN|nr:hypothetical protein [Stakelama flava]MBW4329695.1 hypothetical protein [Stakelama flava]
MPMSAQNAKSRPVTVETPRVYDAVGSALRNAYDRDRGLPDDMARALNRLDDVPAHSGHN